MPTVVKYEAEIHSHLQLTQHEITVDSRHPSSLPHFKTFNPRAADVAAWVQIEAVAKTIDMGHIHQDPLFYAVPAPEYLCDNSYA